MSMEAYQRGDGRLVVLSVEEKETTMKSYKLTLRRRLTSGELEEVAFKVEHACPDESCVCTPLDDAHIGMMLVDAEYQTNNGISLDGTRGPVRAWIDEIER